jgi:hypothetical protein
MESVAINLQERLERVFAQKALSTKELRVARMPLGELLYFALIENADRNLIGQA